LAILQIAIFNFKSFCNDFTMLVSSLNGCRRETWILLTRWVV